MNSDVPPPTSPAATAVTSTAAATPFILSREQALELVELMKNEDAVKGHLERLRGAVRDLERQVEEAQRSLALFGGQLSMAGKLLVGSESREMLLRYPAVQEVLAGPENVMEEGLLWSEGETLPESDASDLVVEDDLSMDWPDVIGAGSFGEDDLVLEEEEAQAAADDGVPGGELLDAMLDTFVDETGDVLERAGAEELAL